MIILCLLAYIISKSSSKLTKFVARLCHNKSLGNLDKSNEMYTAKNWWCFARKKNLWFYDIPLLLVLIIDNIFAFSKNIKRIVNCINVCIFIFVYCSFIWIGVESKQIDKQAPMKQRICSQSIPRRRRRSQDAVVLSNGGAMKIK